MEEVEEVFGDWIASGAMDEAAAYAGAAADGAAAEAAAVNSFADQALSTAGAFKDWVVTKLKAMSVTDLLMIGGGVVMIYELVQKHAEAAQQTGNRVKLSAAIDGVRSTLEEKYDDTIKSVAQSTKANTDLWNGLSPDIQKTLNEEIAMTGDIYWASVGQNIMETMATMPIYDPT